MPVAAGIKDPSMRGPIFDITHFDVLPVNAGLPDSFLQIGLHGLV